MKISYSSLGVCCIYIEKQKPYIAMLFVQFAYAGMALISKAAMNGGMSPYIFVAYRQAFATAFLAPFAFFIDRNNAASLSFKILLKIFFISLFGISLSLTLYTYSLNYTSATFAAATSNTIPLMTFLMAALLRMESVSMKKGHGVAKVLGCGIGFCGAMVFAFVKGPRISILKWAIDYHKGDNILGSSPPMVRSTNSHGQWIKGSLVMLLANMVWSSWLIMLAPIVKEYPAKLRLTTLQCLFSCIQSTVFAIAVERDPSSWKLGWDINLFSVAYCGVMVTGITYWLQVWAVDKRGPVFTAMFTPFALIITAIVSAIVWKELLRFGNVCGAILLVGGLYCVLWGKNKEAEAQEEGDEEKEQKTQSNKEIQVVECITHQ